MAQIKAFRAYRPQCEQMEDMLTLPYFTSDVEEDKQKIKDKPYSFLRVERAEVCFDTKIAYNDMRVYEASKKNLNQMIADGILLQEEKECFYLYQMKLEGRVQTGMVSCVSVEDYRKGIVKRHELTKEEKEQDRINHLKVTQANTSPVFLIYQNSDRVKQIMKDWTESREPLYSVVTEDEVTHTIWRIDNPVLIEELTVLFSEMNAMYIADGHHRIAACAKVWEESLSQAETEGDADPYFLAAMFPADELKILEYDRILTNFKGLTPQEFYEKLSQKFEVRICDDQKNPEDKYSFGMLFENAWYDLCLKQEFRTQESVVDQLNVSIFQKYILEEILDIQEIRKNTSVKYVGGVKRKKDLEIKCGESQVGFHLYPTQIHELLAVADSNQIMPPKSTWFEPKPRSGFLIYKKK